MSTKVDVPRPYDVKLSLEGGQTLHEVHVLDVDPEAIVVRVGAELAAEENVEEVTLRYGHREFQWEVPTRVVATYGAWWILHRPDDVDCKRFQRRAFVRIGYETSMFAIPTDGQGRQIGAPRPFSITNLSASGCLAVSDEHLGRLGEHLMVFLSLPGLPTMPALATVVRAQEDGPLKRYGLHFDGLTGQPQEQVVQFVTTQIREGLAKGQDISFREPVAS